MQKIHNSSKTDLEYSISLDEDVILGNHAWDNFIENINILDDYKNLVISPLMSIGVDMVDTFVELLNGNIDNIYLNVDFIKTGEAWKVDYTSLNTHTIYSDRWDYLSFYKSVEKINHHYKGIHPVRVSSDAQTAIAKLVLDNYDEFLKKRNTEFIIYDRPYFTNHIFAIKTKVWNCLLNKKEFFKDAYDEVALNLFRRHNNMNIVTLTSALGIHAAYNTIGKEAQYKIEQILLEGLNEKISY